MAKFVRYGGDCETQWRLRDVAEIARRDRVCKMHRRLQDAVVIARLSGDCETWWKLQDAAEIARHGRDCEMWQRL